MKICFFDDEPELYPIQYGGKARTILNLAQSFVKHKDVDKVTIMSRSIYSNKNNFIKNNINFISLDDNNTILKIKEACDEYDIVNIHCCSFTFPLINNCKAKKVYFLHDVLIATADKGSHLDKALGGSFDCIVAPSEYAKDIFDKNKKILKEESNCKVIPRHINKELFQKITKEEVLNDKKAPQVLKNAIMKYEKIIFFPSRPIEEKGGKYILDIAPQLEKNNICIIGPFEDNSNSNIINTGWIKSEEMKYYYSSSDVTCNFSLLPESFSQVCIESIYCGTPVVSFGTGNIKRLSELTDAIILCKKDKKSIIEGINKAITYKNIDKEIKKISMIFDKEKIVNNYIELYKQLMGDEYEK